MGAYDGALLRVYDGTEVLEGGLVTMDQGCGVAYIIVVLDGNAVGDNWVTDLQHNRNHSKRECLQKAIKTIIR